NLAIPTGVPGRLRKRGELGLATLKFSRDEGSQVAKSLEQIYHKRPVVLFGDQARKDVLLTLKQVPCVVHLSTHSLFRTSKVAVDDPLLYCAIAFAGWNYLPDENQNVEALPGVMTGAEVVGLNLHGTEIVVLSSCESGTGTREIGERSADLRHAFHL